MNNDKIYAVRNKSTGKLVSDLTNPRKKYWDKRNFAEKAMRGDVRSLELVVFKLVEVKDDDKD